MTKCRPKTFSVLSLTLELLSIWEEVLIWLNETEEVEGFLNLYEGRSEDEQKVLLTTVKDISIQAYVNNDGGVLINLVVGT